MKRLIFIVLSTFISTVAFAMEQSAEQEPTDTLRGGNIALWNEANAAYLEGKFAEAVVLYDSIEQGGGAAQNRNPNQSRDGGQMVSARLFYNKGNALFKDGQIGRAILYYNKARRLAPADADIAHNLAIANTYTQNRIEPMPEFFLRQWTRALSSAMNGDGWAGLSVALFALLLVGALLYLLPSSLKARRAGFYGGLAALALLVFAFSFAVRAWRESTDPTEGIVTSASAAVKGSPDNSGTDLFLLHEGDKVTVRDVLGDWSEITVANGNRGWVKSGTFEMID